MDYLRIARTELVLLLAGFVLVAGQPTLAQTPEFRAMWLSRFEWPDPDPTTAQANIDLAMADLAAANFNAVFMQVRGQADVLYPSPEEVWSPLIGGSDPGWDPLAYAIASAHASGLEFHAYINTHTCWQSVPASAHTLPSNPAHLFYEHCNSADPAHRDWLHHNTPTNPVDFSESEYVWIAPGVPAFQAYIRRQILYVVENYDVDGVHYDRIRTPWSNQPSYDPISLARFNDPQSNPDSLDFTAWTADQLTRNVRDIYAAIQAVKPNLKVSAAVFSNPSTAPTAQHQAALTWAQTGGLDIIVPMMYFSGGSGSTWDTRLQTWIGGSGGRHVVAGHITSQGGASLLDQIALTRTRGGQGNAVFSWSSFTWWTDYLNNVYQLPAAVPAMSWKDTPTTAVIHGYVTDANSTGLVDVQVTRNGSSYSGLSTGDGFYSLLLVPPGTYTLSAWHPGYGAINLPGVSVGAGQVLRQDFQFSGVLPPVIAEVSPDPDSAVEGEEYTRSLLLAQGTADSWSLSVNPHAVGAMIDLNGNVLGWTPSAADAGNTFTFTATAANSAGSDDEVWNVTVNAAPPCDVVTLADFENASVGVRTLFNLPRFSGSTSDDLEFTPNTAEVTDAVPGHSGSQSMMVEWAFVNTSPDRWLRLTTYNGLDTPNPTVPLDRPIRVRLRLDSGRLALAIGIRETGTTAEIGENGGTSGAIEWIGADSDTDGAPQGVLVEGQPGVWQTFIFDPATDPIHGQTGDGVLFTATGKGVFEQLAFSVVDSAGPFTVYIDDIEVLCSLPAYGDLNDDGDVDLQDYALMAACLNGPENAVTGGCLEADADGDTDVDLEDVAAFARALAP